MTSAAPSANHVVVAVLYGLGAFGIMTLNDFKALKGDMITGVRSLPLMLGPKRAASIACLVILCAQLAVVAVLIAMEDFIHGGIIMLLLLPQLWAMSVLLKAPKEKAPWFNGTGVLLYITGMMVSLRGLMP
jgi:chlorophyll synthase